MMRVPPPRGSKRYSWVMPKPGQRVCQASRRGASRATIRLFTGSRIPARRSVIASRSPCRRAAAHTGLHSGQRATSAKYDHTASGG